VSAGHIGIYTLAAVARRYPRRTSSPASTAAWLAARGNKTM